MAMVLMDSMNPRAKCLSVCSNRRNRGLDLEICDFQNNVLCF